MLPVSRSRWGIVTTSLGRKYAHSRDRRTLVLCCSCQIAAAWAAFAVELHEMLSVGVDKAIVVRLLAKSKNFRANAPTDRVARSFDLALGPFEQIKRFLGQRRSRPELENAPGCFSNLDARF